MHTTLALLILAVAVYFLLKGIDVRLVLFTAGLALASAALKPWLVFNAFLESVGKEEVVGPICSAMGYAFVLKATLSDQEMVRVLIAPLRRARWLLVPGGCIVGFLTNIAITSQTAAAAAVGSILVPLMFAAGYPPITVAATLVLGCSGGGNLFNPGDPDVVAIYENTKGQGALVNQVIDAMLLPELLGFAAATATLTLFTQFLSRKTVATPAPCADVKEDPPIDYFKALLPPLPIAMLFLTQPRWELFPQLLQLYPKGLPVSHAMVASTMIALLVQRRKTSESTKAFFEGMGFAFTHVISLIIAANCLIEGMRAIGLIDLVIGGIREGGPMATVLSGFFPWLLAVVSGSGTAPSVAFSNAVLPHLSEGNLSGAIDLGVLASIAASFGRTMSPVAAVVIYAAALTQTTPLQIVRRTTLALALGAAVVLGVMLLR